MKNFNFFEKLWEHGRTLRRVGLVLVMCLIAIPQVWATHEIYEVYLVYEFNGSNNNWTYYVGDKKDNPVNDLGTLTSNTFKIKEIYWKTRDNWKVDEICAYALYNIGAGETLMGQYLNYYGSHDDDAGGCDNHELGNSNVNHTVATANTGNSGVFTFSHYFKATFKNNSANPVDNWTYCSNNSQNYNFTFKILPPNATAITATATAGAISGSGTELDPYIVPYGGNLTIGLSGSAKERNDDNSEVQYSVDEGSSYGTTSSYTSYTISNITATSLQNYVFKARCYNSTASLESPTKTTKTVYYKAANAVPLYKFVVNTGVGDGNVCDKDNTDYPQTVANGKLSTLIGGTLTARGNGSEGNLKYNNNSFNFNGGSNFYLKVVTDSPLKTGDIIRYINSNSGSVAIRLTQNSSTKEIVLAGNSKSTIQFATVTSDFNGQTTFYIDRKSNTSYLEYFEILRSPYTITLNATTNGGTVSPTAMYFAASDPLLLPRATKSSNRFKGWYTGASNDVKVSDYYTATETTTLYAQFDECTSSGTVYKFKVKTDLANNTKTAGELNVSNFLSTLDGGTAVMTGTHAQIVNTNAISFANNGDYITVDLDCALQTGDTIITTISGSKSGIKITSTSSTSSIQNINFGTKVKTIVPSGLNNYKTFRLYEIDTNCEGLSYFEIKRPAKYTITHDISNVTKTNGETEVIHKSDYTAVYTAAGGYELPDAVTVMRGAANITASCTWTKASGTLFIPGAQVTGDITITVTAAAPSCSAPTSPSISGTTAYTAGNTINLTASATGTSGSTTYTWYKGADWATASAGSSVGSSATFTKASCVVGDAGTYWCNISNGTGCEVQVGQAITVSCNAVAAVTSLTNSAHTATSLTYTWTKASNASGYTATLYSDADCAVSVEAKALGNVATATFTGLTPNATYYCKVQSKGNGTVYCEDGGTTSKVSGTTDAPSTPTFSPTSGTTVSGSQTITITGHSGSTVYYAWATSAQDAAAIYNGGSGSHGMADVGTASTTVQSGKTLYAISRLSDVNSSVSSASYTVDATAPTLSSSEPANSATNVNTSGNIVLTFSENVTIADASKFSLSGGTLSTGSATVSTNTVTIPYSGLSNSTEYTFSTAAGAVRDAVGNTNAALEDISFTTKAAAPAASCITWEGTPSSWTSSAMTVDENLVLEAVGEAWDINPSSSDYAKVWVEDGTEIKKTVIAIVDHSVGKYLQGSFADGSEIQSLTIGAANNNGTKGKNKKYVVLFSATEEFTNVLAYATGKYAQEITSPSYKDDYNASNLEKAVVVPSGAKYFRIYRKVVKDWVIGDFIADKDYGDGQTIRIFKIEACPAGASCTTPTIAWSTTPANGVAGGTMTASVTSNYPAGVTYSSSDATVASVNASTGVISYLKAGSATITATVEGDGTTYCNLTPDPSVSQAITVTAVATGIAITPSTIDVQVGGTKNLVAALTPAGAADETVTWTSEYTANATVALADEDEDKAAVVTGVALRPGGTSFKIYAKTSRLTANSWYATVRVYKGVTYDASTNSGTCATASAKYYGDAALVLPAATRTGYTFDGWYTTSSGGTKIGDAGDEYTPTANSTTLYAQFTENVTTYAITYELNGGTHGTAHPTTGTPSTAHELSAPTRSGYTFTGWSVSPVVSGAKCGTTSSPATAITDASTLAENGTSSVWFKDLAAANGAVTITAHWTRDCESGGSTTLYSFTVNNTGSDVYVTRSGGSESLTTSNTFSSLSGGTATAVNINTSSGGPDKMVGTENSERHIRFTSAQYQYVTIAMSQSLAKGDVIAFTGNGSAQIYITTSSTWSNSISTKSNSYTIPESSSLIGVSTIYIWGTSTSAKIKTFTVTRSGSGASCYHVTYHANGAERGTVEDAARYVKDATVTVKANGFTKAGADFLGWATSKSRADAGTIDYDPDDSFTMSTADVDLWAVWGTAAPRVYSLTGSTYRCTSDEASTITLAGSETGVSYQLKKDGVADGDPVTGTGSSLTWSKTAWGTYTVVATRSAVSSTMSGEVVLSDYPLVVTENLNGGTVAKDGAFTLSAKVSVHADNSASYTYEWFSNDAANYDNPTSLGDATAMAASTGTQEFEYNPSTASGGTTYYFCEFKSPCNTIVRTRVVSVKVTTATTTFTWDRDGAGDDFEDLPQGGKHTITVTSNSGVAPSLEVAGTDVELTDVEQNAETATTTATLVLGASAADVVLTAEVSANDEYAEKSEDKEVIVKECSAGSATVLLSAYLSAYNAFTKDGGSGTATISNPGSDTHVTCSEKNYYKMTNGSTYYTFTLGGTEKFQAGDRIIFDVASADQGNEKDFKIGLKASTSGSELHAVSTTLTTCEEVTFTIPVGSGLINGNTVIITRNSSENRVYGVSIVRGGGSGSAADVASVIAWITDPDSGHEEGEKAITRSISNDPFTFAVRATTPSMGTITYASSDEDVATVDANGRVTLIGEGTTEISAKQEAIGCYVASSTLSYSLTVASCTGEKEPVITYDGTVICPGGSKTLTATNYEDGATFQWYKDDAEIDGATDETYDATAAGTYTVVAHKDCYSESSNSVTLTKMSATVDVKTYADEFTIKSERPYNFRLFEIEDGATMTVQSRSGIDPENSEVELSGNTITISGTAPEIGATGDATVVIRINRTGCSDSHVDKTVTIHKIPATAKPTIAWIATKTTIKDKKEVAVKGVKDEVDADKSSDVDLYQELEKYYTVTARNCYWTTSEAELVKEYSQYDLIVLTDYPNSQTAPSGNDKTKSYTNAIGLLKDHIPMLTFEAYVAQCPNWEIPSNPQNTSNTQNDITLLCNADEIFGTSGKFGAGSAISVSTVGSGQALQGFLPADAPFVFIGSITDDGTTYIACCERQVNPAARMLIFGLNANTMNNLTSDGKEMVRGFINYLMISDAASIPDCSVIFNGGAGPADQNWNTAANWEGNTMPNQYASVRIDKPCVVSGNYVAQAGYLKIHTSTNESTYPYTGKLTIASDGVMAIDGTITRVEDNRYTLHLPTRPEDLIIRSGASGQGALIFDNDEGTTQARVEMYSKAYTTGEGVNLWQYVAVPLNSASRWTMGDYAYVTNNETGRWNYNAEMYDAFTGVGVTRLQSTTATYTFDGPLASTKTQKLTIYNNAKSGTNMVGNSWTAPIQIVNFEEEDFGGANASVFIYETGHDPDNGPTHESGNSGERAAGKWYEIPVFGAATLVTSGGWAGMKVIPAMQAFEIKNKTGANTTLTLDYDRLVRTATNNMNEAMRAPRRMEASNEIATLRVTMSDGEIRNDVYLLSGERFSEGFDNGWDGEYVGGNNCSQLYALSPIGNLSMSAQPEMEGTILGFAAGTKPEFTITFHYVGEEELYLNDMEAHRSTLISGENEYTFTAESGEKGDRFVIGEQLFGASEIATGVTDLDAEATEAQKIIYNDKLYIIRGGKVFSAEGQLVK